MQVGLEAGSQTAWCWVVWSWLLTILLVPCSWSSRRNSCFSCSFLLASFIPFHKLKLKLLKNAWKYFFVNQKIESNRGGLCWNDIFSMWKNMMSLFSWKVWGAQLEPYFIIIEIIALLLIDKGQQKVCKVTKANQKGNLLEIVKPWFNLPQQWELIQANKPDKSQKALSAYLSS